jgi:tetratricopeptide (TPR) repeat protein
MDSLEYIDDYFKGGLPPEEARQFESRIQDDPVFAEEVAYYLSTLVAFKEEQIAEKKRNFHEIYRQTALEPPQTELDASPVSAMPPQATIRPMKRRRWIPALAAAILIGVIALGWILFLSPPTAPKLADQYIRQNLDQLSVKMGPADSMQTGITLYDDGKFPEALHQFEGILATDSMNSTAMLDAGIVSLRMEHYDQALDFFTKLQNRTDPHINPSLFYEALTLMKRNRSGDATHAKQTLQQIVQEDLDKKEDAAQLLRKM